MSSTPQVAGSSSIQEKDAQLLPNVKTLTRGRPGSARYRATIKALGLRQDTKADNSKGKTATTDSKDRSGACFAYRDKEECKYGSKCRHSHDKDKICKEQEPKATLSLSFKKISSHSAF